jgi:glycosyltransferase involved in cell wall biosynthesis
MNEQYSAIIPCYNVGPACERVLREVIKYVPMVVVVDDGSNDNTSLTIKQAQIPGVKLIAHSQNRGKGAALMTGFRHLLETHPELDSVLTLDGDGQHDAQLIPKFIESREQHQADLVYGNRMTDLTSMPWHRQQLNSLSNRLISGICKMRIEDSQCGFRLYSTNLLRAIFNELKTLRYELETEILIRSCRKQFKIAGVPISTIYSPETSAMSHHSLTDVLRIGKLLYHLRK